MHPKKNCRDGEGKVPRQQKQMHIRAAMREPVYTGRQHKSEVKALSYEWLNEDWTSSRACLHTSCNQTFSMASWTGWPKRPFSEACIAEGVTMRYVCAMDSPAFCCAPHLNIYASAIPVGAS